MPVSLSQWYGEIGAFYNNTLAFPNISIFCLILSLPYGSIFVLNQSIFVLNQINVSNNKFDFKRDEHNVETIA